ncbi:MAG: hypothetical protein HYR50_15045 [Candidatus Rokubacteria bacterium]|nr:hypothetical protein [Candidatus Rokubacteria bacterium]
MLAARIDRLVPEDKRLLQTASVVGKDVPFALLQAIADLPDEVLRSGLSHLQAAGFLYETGLLPDLEYAFAHALTHEVTYGGLLQTRRRGLHSRIVVAIEATYADRLVEHIERLADHAVRGQDWAKAARYLYQAGQKALARSAGREAVSYLEAALTSIEQLPPEPDLIRTAVDVRLLLRQALRFSGDLERTERYLREAATLAEQIDDAVRRARSVVGLANLRWNQGDLRAATDYALEARGLGQAADEPSIVAHASVVLTFSWHCRGDYVRAEASAHEVLGLAPRVPRGSYYGHLVPPAVAARAYLALTHAERGGFEAAIADGEAALRLAEEASQPFTIGIAAWGLGYVHRLRANFDGAHVLLQRGFDIAKEWKLEWWLANLGWLLGHVEALSGRHEGLIRLREALDRFEVRGFGAHRSLFIVNLGEAYLESGDVRAAQDAGRNALMRARQFGERGYEAWALRLLGDCASLGADVSESDIFYQDAQALAIELGMGPLAAHCHLGLGKPYQRTGQREQAREHLTTATTLYREMDMRFWLERAEAELRSVG